MQLHLGACPKLKLYIVDSTITGVVRLNFALIYIYIYIIVLNIFQLNSIITRYVCVQLIKFIYIFICIYFVLNKVLLKVLTIVVLMFSNMYGPLHLLHEAPLFLLALSTLSWTFKEVNIFFLPIFPS